MKKTIFAFMVLIVLIGLLEAQSGIIYTPDNPKVGERVRFSSITGPYYGCSNCTWTFGDGTSVSGVSDTTPVYHAYNRAGTYTVRISYGGCFTVAPADDVRTIVVTDDRYISVSPNAPDVGQAVTFTLEGAIGPPILWDFGDGTRATSPGNSITHAYAKEGNYTVQAFDNGGSDTISVTRAIKVNLDPRKVTWTPASPYDGQTVNFSAMFFKAPNLQWNFGDGTVIIGPHNIQHTYQNFGTYTVNVEDYAGDDVKSFNYQIVVKQDPRQLLVSNSNPGVGERVIFEASQFFSNEVYWDFGDGTGQMGPKIMSHIFARDGVFVVRAEDPATGVRIRGRSGRSAGDLARVFETAITVSATPSTVSNLMITGMEIFFERNSRTYLTIPAETEKEKVKAVLKYEGSGLLSGYWAIDGQPYKLISETLSFGQSVELILDEIPTLITGIHRVSIIFNYPTPSFEVIPSIQYFVSPLSRFVTVESPHDEFDFALTESREFKWEQYPLALNYRLKVAETLEDLMSKTPENSQETDQMSLIWTGDLKKDTRYVWQVEAIDINGKPIAASQVMSFTIVDNILNIKEEKPEPLIKREGKNIELLSFKMGGSQILNNRYYLVRTFANGVKVDSRILPGSDLGLVQTSVEYIRGASTKVEVKVYLIEAKRLKLMAYFSKILK